MSTRGGACEWRLHSSPVASLFHSTELFERAQNQSGERASGRIFQLVERQFNCSRQLLWWPTVLDCTALHCAGRGGKRASGELARAREKVCALPNCLRSTAKNFFLVFFSFFLFHLRRLTFTSKCAAESAAHLLSCSPARPPARPACKRAS